MKDVGLGTVLSNGATVFAVSPAGWGEDAGWFVLAVQEAIPTVGRYATYHVDTTGRACWASYFETCREAIDDFTQRRADRGPYKAPAAAL